jgi:hypothetical protein
MLVLCCLMAEDVNFTLLFNGFSRIFIYLFIFVVGNVSYDVKFIEVWCSEHICIVRPFN